MWLEATALRGVIGQQRNTLGVTGRRDDQRASDNLRRSTLPDQRYGTAGAIRAQGDRWASNRGRNADQNAVTEARDLGVTAGETAHYSSVTKGRPCALSGGSHASTMPCGDLALREGSVRPPRTSIRGNPSSKLDVTAGETAPSLTPKRQGHWRCVFYVNTSIVAVELQPNARWLSDTEIVAGPQWPSEEIADERGRADTQVLPPRFRPFVRYVRAEYYPEYA